MHCEAASGSRAGLKVSPVQRRTFAHPDQPMAAPGRHLVRSASRSVIEYLDLEFCLFRIGSERLLLSLSNASECWSAPLE